MAEIFSDEDTTRLFQLVHMFQRSALLHMGYIPDQQGNKYFDMAEAKEALDLYQTKLTPDGTIIFHISNRHYDIASVITSTALNKWDVYGFATPPDTLQAFQDFALFCAIRLKNSNSSDLINSGWRPMANYQYKSKPWSDDYINTLEPLYFKFIDK